MMELPFNLAKYSSVLISQKVTMIMSSVPGPKEALQYGDSKIDAITCFIPSIGDTVFGIAMVSLGDILKIAMMADQSSISKPDEFMHILNTKVKDFIQEGKQLKIQ